MAENPELAGMTRERRDEEIARLMWMHQFDGATESLVRTLMEDIAGWAYTEGLRQVVLGIAGQTCPHCGKQITWGK